MYCCCSAVGTCGVPKTMTERSMVQVLQSQMPGAIVATPRGTTQVVTRCNLDPTGPRPDLTRWSDGGQRTRYEVADRGVIPRYEELFQVAAGQSERGTWHLACVNT
ncbi:hypothetical protein Tco_0284276, partial [Tanacetum coccineum]